MAVASSAVLQMCMLQVAEQAGSPAHTNSDSSSTQYNQCNNIQYASVQLHAHIDTVIVSFTAIHALKSHRLSPSYTTAANYASRQQYTTSARAQDLT